MLIGLKILRKDKRKPTMKYRIQRTICLLDTSIFDLYLRVYGQDSYDGEFDDIIDKFNEKAKTEKMFLPMATIIETGNHIAQVTEREGKNKKIAADFFVELVEQAIEGKAPFTLVDFLEARVLKTWIKEYPQNAIARIGLADLSIKKDFDKLVDSNKGTRVYIWSKDNALLANDTHPPQKNS